MVSTGAQTRRWVVWVMNRDLMLGSVVNAGSAGLGLVVGPGLRFGVGLDGRLDWMGTATGSRLDSGFGGERWGHWCWGASWAVGPGLRLAVGLHECLDWMGYWVET